jgi:hypothetical protein
MVTGSERLGPLSDYTANCRPVLSSERAPYMKKESNCQKKKIKGPDCKAKWRPDSKQVAKLPELEVSCRAPRMQWKGCRHFVIAIHLRVRWSRASTFTPQWRKSDSTKRPDFGKEHNIW